MAKGQNRLQNAPGTSAGEPEEQRDGERLDDYEGVDEHRRPTPERGRRAMEGPLQPVH